MDEVTSDECPLPFRRDPYTDMSGSVARCRFEPHFIAQLVIGLDPIHKTSGKHRVHTITYIIAGMLLFPMPCPVFVFVTGNEVTCVLERRLPFAVTSIVFHPT